MAGIVDIQQEQGVRHALLLIPMPLLGASQHGEAQNFVGYNKLLVCASLPLHLIKYVKQFIEGISEHLWLVPLPHHVLVMQGAAFHGRGLEHGDALIPPS